MFLTSHPTSSSKKLLTEGAEMGQISEMPFSLIPKEFISRVRELQKARPASSRAGPLSLTDPFKSV